MHDNACVVLHKCVCQLHVHIFVYSFTIKNLVFDVFTCKHAFCFAPHLTSTNDHQVFIV